LLPVLGPRIVELVKGSVDSAFVEETERAVEQGRRQGIFLQLISRRLMTMLAEHGISSAPLKGPLLGEAIYGDAGRRLSSDIDLLVSPWELSAAVDVVRELGYASPIDHVQRDGLPLLHFAMLHERGALPRVDLHWRVHWYERRFAHERLLPAPGPRIDWRAAPVDDFAALLLFYARDGFIDLRVATDIGAWWDVFGTAVPQGALDELLVTYPALSRVIPVALKVAERIVGLPAVEIMENMPTLDARNRMAVRLANPNPRTSQSQLYADSGLIDGLLSPPGGLGPFIRRQVFPPREVLAEQARHAARLRTRSRLGRCLGVLVRYMITVMQLARPRETLP
jgi:hypothetical protein